MKFPFFLAVFLISFKLLYSQISEQRSLQVSWHLAALPSRKSKNRPVTYKAFAKELMLPIQKVHSGREKKGSSPKGTWALIRKEKLGEKTKGRAKHQT